MKKYYPYFHFVLLTIVLGVSSLQAIAQQTFPVVARFTQLPPYPVYLADFSNPSQTNLSIQVQQNDATIASRPFKIRIYIEGNGFLIESTDMVQGEPPLTLAFGQIYNLPAAQVANYFKQYNLKVTPAQYSRPFNEGTFRFGVQIIDFQTNRTLSGIQWATPVWITINEPPVWVMPQASQTSIIPTTPQNITFQWAPRHTNVSDVEYEFTLTELITPQGFQGNIQNLFLAQPAFYKTRTRNLTFNYNITLPPLVEGRTYAYRVQAIAKRGLEDVGVFRNNGFSEIQSFKYGEPLLPPTNLKLAWADNNKEANFNWKGEPEHKSFVVEVREKGQKGDWKNSTSPAQVGSVLNATLLNNLDPTKSYEARITGVDDKGRKATSSVINLNISPIPPKIEELKLTGKVLWAYNANENSIIKVGLIEKFTENGAVKDLFEKDIDKKYQRKTDLANFLSATPAVEKYPLEGATVTLYRAEEELTATNFSLREKQKLASRVSTAATNAQGEYTINGQGLKLLVNAKFLYVVAEYKGTIFTPALVKLDSKMINLNATGTQKVDDLIEVANSIRYIPKIVTNDKKEEDFEEIGLYRLKSTIDKNKYLSEEGILGGARGTINYNNDVYVKVADFEKMSTATKLFYNKPYNDKFVLRVKEKGNDRPRVFPVNDIEKFEEGKYTQITDYFIYNNNHLISGIVERDGIPKEPVKNAAVKVFGKLVRTNEKGYYEIEIPKGTTKIAITAIDPLNTNTVIEESVTYQAKDETKNFLLKGKGHCIGGRICGSDGRYISGAKLEYQGKTITTDAEGYFKMPGTGQLLQNTIKITFDGYEPLQVQADKFKITRLEEDLKADKRQEKLFELLKQAKLPEPEAKPEAKPSGMFAFWGNLAKSLANNLANTKDLNDKQRFYDDNYTNLKLELATIYKTDSLVLYKEMYYRLVAYTNKINSLGLRSQNDSMTVVSATLSIENKEQKVALGKLVSKAGEKEIWTGGYVSKAFTKVKVKVQNKPDLPKDSTMYLEEELEIPLPAKYSKDTVVIKVRLRPIKYLYGIVYDSTTFIKGVHTDDDIKEREVLGKKRRLVRLPGDPYNPMDSTYVSVNGSKVMTDAKGHFKVLVPQGEECNVELTKTNFGTSKYAISTLVANRYSKEPSSDSNRKDFYILQQDPNVPKFETLLGFSIKVDRAVKQSSEAFLLSGVLYLDKGKLDPGLRSADQVALKDFKNNIFTAGATKELNFKNIVVKKDAKTATNAVTVAKSINFIESEANILLFGYAPIKLQGNPVGEPYIRLNHLDVKAGAAVSEGKIGASKMEFTQQTMMGIKFGKMVLKVKDPEKEAKFGKFDDKVSDKEGTKKEKEYNLDRAKVAVAVAVANSKEAIDNGKNLKIGERNVELQKAEIAAKKAEAATKDDKNAGEKKEKEKIEKETKTLEKALPSVEKEPLLLAFAPSNLEELADTKEFSIEFVGAAKKGDTNKKEAGGKEDKYKDYLKFALSSAPGEPTLTALKSTVMAGIDPESPVLKKSGISMKGILLIPQIWRFKDNGNPMTIEKLEIDKKFLMKTAIIGKSDPNKKEIKAFGVGGSWMCYFNTVQIYNDFKGFGIGGTINNDKENYVNINSLGFSRVDGQFYPNIDLSTPEGGFRVSNLRFKTIGKKNITIKGNPAEKSYEIEGSLRIEYDDTKFKNSKTDSTDRYGKRLSDADIETNKDKAKEASDATAKQADVAAKQPGAAANREKAESTLTELIKQSEIKIKAHQEQIEVSKNEQEITKETRLKKAEETKLAKLNENLKKVKELREGDIAIATKKEADEKAKADKAIVDKNKQETIAAGKSYVDTTAAKSKNVGWKERVFPIEVQLFKWSTTGKWIVSASPSQDALKFGPVAIKIRRLVFAKGVKADPVKESEIQDLLKMTDDEMKKINSTAKFNDANTFIDKDGKRIGATSKESKDSKAGASVDGLTIKGIEDKVAAENPMSSAWAFGFAGGLEVETKTVNVESEATLYVGDFDGKGVVFKLNEIQLVVKTTAFTASAKVKIGTSGKKIGFEGEGEFEGAKIKTALSLKFYKLYDDNGIATGTELGASIKVSTGPLGIPMGPITWTTLGGGFDLNTADQKFSVFFLGDAKITGTVEKITSLKKIKISIDFEGKECGDVPIIRGSMEWWTGIKGGTDEKICDVKAEVNFCLMRVLATMDCEMNVGESKVNVNAIVLMSTSTGIFLGAKVRANMFDMNVNGTFALGILCNFQDSQAPTQLAAFRSEVPPYLFQTDAKTFSGIYLGVDVSYEKKGGGSKSAFGLDVASYSYSIALSGKLKAGLSFSNGNFAISAATNVVATGSASLLKFDMNGELKLDLALGGGYNNEQGWNLKGSAYGNLMIGAGNYQNETCNDYEILGFKTTWICMACCDGTSYKCWKRISRPTYSGRGRFIKLCLEGDTGFSYQQRGPAQLVGWKGYVGGAASR